MSFFFHFEVISSIQKKRKHSEIRLLRLRQTWQTKQVHEKEEEDVLYIIIYGYDMEHFSLHLINEKVLLSF